MADAVLALDHERRRPRTPASTSPAADLVGGELLARRRAGRRPAPAAPCAGGCAAGPRAAWPGPGRPGGPPARRGGGSRPPPSAGWSSLMELTMFSPGMSAAVTTTTRRPVEGRVELEAEQARVGLGGADRRAVPGAGEDEVVGVAGPAGQLVRPLAPQRRRACSTERRHRRLPGHGYRKHDGSVGQGSPLLQGVAHAPRSHIAPFCTVSRGSGGRPGRRTCLAPVGTELHAAQRTLMSHIK